MKFLIFTLLALLALTSSVYAQQVDPPSMELDSGPTDSDTAVIRTIEVVSVNNTGNSTEAGGDGAGGEDGKDGQDGEDGEDGAAPVPTLYLEGTELDDIGAPTRADDAEVIKIMNTNTESVEREMKESGEKGGTTDINIGVGELNSDDAHKDWIIIESASGPTRMNKADLIESIANDSGGGVHAVFVKIDTIKGESDDGAESKKPKEIVVVGSKVREVNVLQLVGDGAQDNTNADSFFDVWTEVSTTEDLQLHAIRVAQENENIAEIKLSESMVHVKLKEKIKLFGIIPVQVQKTVEVQTDTKASDRVKIKFPWWHVFATKDMSINETETKIGNELNSGATETTEADDRPTEEVAFYYNKISAQILQTISNTSKQ